MSQSHPMREFYLERREHAGRNVILLPERFRTEGFDVEFERFPDRVSLTLDGKTYIIKFGDFVRTNFKRGDDFVLIIRTPTVDEFYAMAA